MEQAEEIGLVLDDVAGIGFRDKDAQTYRFFGVLDGVIDRPIRTK